MQWLNASWHWWLVHSGTSELKPNVWYNAWSGWVSDIGELAIIGAIIGGYHKVNCHIKRCPRFAHHEYELGGVKYRLCRKHHPGVNEDDRPTAADFAAHHKRATGDADIPPFQGQSGYDKPEQGG